MALPDGATGNALKRLADRGSDLALPMEMDSFIAVPPEASGLAVAAEVREHGFATSVERDAETGDWTCYCTKTIVPSYIEVVRIENRLDELARPHGGYADGFGSFGNAD
ncbi:MAG TPA: ribonuclease E inhibitor RraB [Afifellaceae bacterium]|nr:ribonuclease E inhibitor RraB [Afifellaceae bacterium]